MKYLGTIFLSVFLTVMSFAQIVEPVKWSFSSERISETEYNLVFKAKIEKKWHLYSVYSPENGPLPLFFDFKANESYELVGKVKETPKPHVVHDETFKVDVKQFSDKATFKQKIKVAKVGDYTISGLLDGQACIDDGMCVPISKNFDIKISASDKIVEVKEEPVEETHIEKAETGDKEDKAELKETKKDTKKKKGLWAEFWIAFGFGLLALITPCVFPMIPMTVSFFMKGNKSRSAGLKQAYFFGFSIVAIFAILGLALTLLLGKDAMYIISTHWIPNTLFFVIFMVFALSFFGMFELTLPSWLVNKSDANADKGGYLGTFFVAFTTVLVSFSCTGPILGAALIELSSGSDNSMIFFVSMVGFALGFALPFTLLAMFPSALKNMRSGSWLNSVKIVFGFIEIALGLKFLSMADLGANWGLLDRETYLALWIVVFAMLGFYLLGKLKFKGDSDLPKIGVGRLFLSIVTFSFVVYMIPGLWGAPLKALSGYLPPMTTQDFDIERIIVENKGSGGGAHTSDLGKVKHGDILHLPTGFHGFFDLEEAKAYAKKVNKPIFVDFTGKTCANCREMENNVWNAAEVKKIMTEDYVIVALYADANFIDLEEDEWVTDENGRVLKTLGKKNLNYQITRFNMNAQPYYVLMDAEENVLTKENKAYDKEVSNFVNFLEEGLKNFHKK